MSSAFWTVALLWGAAGPAISIKHVMSIAVWNIGSSPVWADLDPTFDDAQCDCAPMRPGQTTRSLRSASMSVPGQRPPCSQTRRRIMLRN